MDNRIEGFILQQRELATMTIRFLAWAIEWIMELCSERGKIRENYVRPNIEGIEKRECIQGRGVDFMMTDDFAWAI